jgi:nitroreductase
MKLDLSPEEVLTTTRTVRKRLDLQRPVERDVAESCLRIAFQAPNASDHQTWDWILVDDPGTRERMAEIYRAAFRDFVEGPRKTEYPAAPDSPKQRRLTTSITYLYDHLGEVPLLLVPTFHGRVENKGVFWQASRWGSIAPAIWNLMLALRLHGLGSAWTTMHLMREQEMSDLLGIPSEETQAGLFPIAYTVGTDFKPADRSGSDGHIRWNKW